MDNTNSFTLRSLLLAFVVIASALGTFGPAGLVWGVAIVAGIAAIRTGMITLLGCFFWLAVGALFFACCLLPGVPTAREAARRMQCRNNLKQIALALDSYEGAYGSFPPAYVVGPDGKPWHSWRVLILPYLEQQALYDQYHFDEPWDGPHNAPLAASVPSVYVCPSTPDRGSDAHATSYFAVVGPETAWPGAEPRTFADFHDGLSDTILVMEAAGLGVCWMEPRDIPYDRLAAMTAPDEKLIGTVAHSHGGDFFTIREDGGITVAFADGHVSYIPRGASGKQLAPFLTIQGGEQADVESIPLVITERPNWPRILSLATLAISTLLLWWSTRPRPKPAES